MFAADTVGYLFGNRQLTNARALSLVGDPEAGARATLIASVLCAGTEGGPVGS
jgi:hypothetical protein